MRFYLIKMLEIHVEPGKKKGRGVPSGCEAETSLGTGKAVVTSSLVEVRSKNLGMGMRWLLELGKIAGVRWPPELRKITEAAAVGAGLSRLSPRRAFFFS
jgi:hypothetical protein